MAGPYYREWRQGWVAWEEHRGIVLASRDLAAEIV